MAVLMHWLDVTGRKRKGLGNKSFSFLLTQLPIFIKPSPCCEYPKLYGLRKSTFPRSSSEFVLSDTPIIVSPV